MGSSRRKTFSVGRTRYHSFFCTGFDMETAGHSTAQSFGPLSCDSKELKPLAIGWNSKFLLHLERYEPLMPKALVGPDCVVRFLKWMSFESFFLQSILKQDAHAMKPLTKDQCNHISRVNSCSNCKKYITDQQRTKHHCHQCRSMLGIICPRKYIQKK